MGNNHFDDIYELLDRYVKLNFLVSILISHASKSAEEFNSNVYDIDFNRLGLSNESANVLNNNPNIVNLKKYHSEIYALAEEASAQVFGYLVRLSNEDKIVVKEYIDGIISNYLIKIGEYQDTYLNLVVEIDKSTKEENSSKTRSLGKMAKSSFNKLYEYNTICQNYSNISSYLRGMIRHNTLK